MHKIKFLFLSIGVILTLHGFTNTKIFHHTAMDFVFSPKLNKVFALIYPTDIEYGNQLIQMNAKSGEIENSLFVGNYPNTTKLTEYEKYAWISFYGKGYVKRVNLNTFTIDKEIYLGPIEKRSTVTAHGFTSLPNDNNAIE